jgi:hypothetical protein
MRHATRILLDRGSLGRRELSDRRALRYRGLPLADRGSAKRKLRSDPVDTTIAHAYYR